MPAADPRLINANKQNQGKKANTGYVCDEMQEHRRSIELRRVQGAESGGSGEIIRAVQKQDDTLINFDTLINMQSGSVNTMYEGDQTSAYRSGWYKQGRDRCR